MSVLREETGRMGRKALWVGAAMALLAGIATASSPEETAISAVIADYARAIETRDLELFRSVKPVLSPDEEQRLRTAFANAVSHSVKITLRSVEVKESQATVHLARRDTIGSIVASFPQTIVLRRGPKGWTIEEIGK